MQSRRYNKYTIARALRLHIYLWMDSLNLFVVTYVLGVTLNTVANDKHVPEVERYIHTLKEQTCATYNTLPFKQMPSHLIIEKWSMRRTFG